MKFDSLMTILGLNQQTPAADQFWNIGNEMMNMDTFVKAGFPMDSLMAKLDDSNFLQGPNGKGDVTYSQCDDDLGTFTLDDSATTNTPNPVTVPCPDLKFHLAGIFSDTTHVDDLHVEVHVGVVPLWSEHHKINKDYDSDFTYDLKWAVPSIAPHGNYKITLSATGSNAGTKGVAMCTQAIMTL